MENYLISKLQVYQSMYMFFIDQITALNKQKAEATYRSSTSIRLMYIPVLTTCIESVLADVFEEFIFLNTGNSQSELETRLLNEISEKTKKASWKDYVDNFELLFGIKINDISSEQCFQAINFLFIFRNQLTHGKAYLHTIENFGETNVVANIDGPYKNVHQYFLDKKLISKEELVALTFINDKILDFFCDNLAMFLTAIYEKIIVKERLLMASLVYGHLISKNDLIHV